MLDLKIINGNCFINGKLEKQDIGIKQGKIVNIGDLEEESKETFDAENDIDKWIYDEFQKTKEQINKNIIEYRLDFAVNEIYEFFWSKFCDVYIEECKNSGNTANLRPLLNEILHLMHPFAPFITEEISDLLFNKSIIS